MATIKDVAKMAGVSTSTVSRALSGKIPVDKVTKQKVMEAVEKLNYSPNALAKGLKEKSTSTIGLIIPNIQNPVFPAVARGVEDIAREKGFNVILCNTDENVDIELDYVDKLKKRWVDGIIFATARDTSNHILKLKEKSFPVVLLIRHMQDNVDAVVIDNFKASYEAVTHLIKRGFKKIAIINGRQDLQLYRDRFEGYKKALNDAGVPISEELITEDLSERGNGYDAMDQLLTKGIMPDAVFAMSDPKAMGVMSAIKRHGFKVPDDIAVVGFDDIETSVLLDPPLTTVSQPLYEMGAKASMRLIELIRKEGNATPRVDLFDAKLVIRGTT